MALPPRRYSPVPRDPNWVPDPPRRTGPWIAFGTLVLVFSVFGILTSCAPKAPSAWNGSSVALVVPTPEPNPFPMSFADFVAVAKAQDGWEGEPKCGAPSTSSNYQVCGFERSGLRLRAESNPDGSLDSIVFTFDRYEMANTTPLFNQLVWDAGLEKQAEAARRMVDGELAHGEGHHARKYVDRVYVRVDFGWWDPDKLTIEFSE